MNDTYVHLYLAYLFEFDWFSKSKIDKNRQEDKKMPHKTYFLSFFNDQNFQIFHNSGTTSYVES